MFCFPLHFPFSVFFFFTIAEELKVLVPAQVSLIFFQNTSKEPIQWTFSSRGFCFSQQPQNFDLIVTFVSIKNDYQGPPWPMCGLHDFWIQSTASPPQYDSKISCMQKSVTILFLLELIKMCIRETYRMGRTCFPKCWHFNYRICFPRLGGKSYFWNNIPFANYFDLPCYVKKKDRL